MIGDVNLFFNDADEPSTAEIEIMIAERDCRGHGYGTLILQMMMHYGMNDLGVTRYTAKIGLNNFPSLKIFKHLGYTEKGRSEYFQEAELELIVDQRVRETANRLQINKLPIHSDRTSK